MATIKIDKVRKCFGNVEVLKEFNQVFEDKEFVTPVSYTHLTLPTTRSV